jgi:hypothetical protein
MEQVPRLEPTPDAAGWSTHLSRLSQLSIGRSVANPRPEVVYSEPHVGPRTPSVTRQDAEMAPVLVDPNQTTGNVARALPAPSTRRSAKCETHLHGQPFPSATTPQNLSLCVLDLSACRSVLSLPRRRRRRVSHGKAEEKLGEPRSTAWPWLWAELRCMSFYTGD